MKEGKYNMIEMRNVTKRYPNGIMAINDVSVRIEDGEFVYVVGPSGAGKSTFIKMMYCDEHLSSGELSVGKFDLTRIKQRELPYLRRYVGVVFQDFKLLEKKTIYENIAYAMEVVGKKPSVIRKRVLEVLDLVGLKHKIRMFPNELSGGEQQRIAIARAIANMPGVLIADEPTGNLDPDTALEIMNILERINQNGTTIIMATHSRTIVNNIKHRVLAIESGRLVRDEMEGEYGYDD